MKRPIVQSFSKNLFQVKKVTCFRCNDKSFTTFLGLKYHLNTCGKTYEELEVCLSLL